MCAIKEVRLVSDDHPSKEFLKQSFLVSAIIRVQSSQYIDTCPWSRASLKNSPSSRIGHPREKQSDDLQWKSTGTICKS